MNIQEFIDELRGHFNTPKNLPRVCELLEEHLQNASGSDLKACALKLVTTRTTRGWPPVSIILQALSEVRKQRWAGSTPQTPATGNQQWDYYRGTTELPVLVRGSPPWLAWLDYRQVHGESVSFMKTRQRWTVPSIWPPGYERHKEEYISRAAKWEDEK